MVTDMGVIRIFILALGLGFMGGYGLVASGAGFGQQALLAEVSAGQ